jgi:hypothetical protein
MPPLEECQLLAKSLVFKKEAMTSTEEPKKCAYQKSDGAYHAKALSHFACGRRRRMLLKSGMD